MYRPAQEESAEAVAWLSSPQGQYWQTRHHERVVSGGTMNAGFYEYDTQPYTAPMSLGLYGMRDDDTSDCPCPVGSMRWAPFYPHLLGQTRYAPLRWYPVGLTKQGGKLTVHCFGVPIA